MCALAVLLVAGAAVAGGGRHGSDVARKSRARRAVVPTTATPDSTLGLSRTSVFSIPVPDRVTLNPADPGPGLELHRMYPGAPPVIPHGIAAFLPITRAENQCLDCHMVEKHEFGEPIPIPISHYLDMRSAPTQVRQEPAGARFVCTSCHVPRTDARPLVQVR